MTKMALESNGFIFQRQHIVQNIYIEMKSITENQLPTTLTMTLFQKPIITKSMASQKSLVKKNFKNLQKAKENSHLTYFQL